MRLLLLRVCGLGCKLQFVCTGRRAANCQRCNMSPGGVVTSNHLFHSDVAVPDAHDIVCVCVCVCIETEPTAGLLSHLRAGGLVR